MRFRRLHLHLPRIRELDARATDAQERAVTAKAEADFSRRRQEAIHESVVKPLTQAAVNNQFAEMLRTNLVQGHRNHS